MVELILLLSPSLYSAAKEDRPGIFFFFISGVLFTETSSSLGYGRLVGCAYAGVRHKSLTNIVPEASGSDKYSSCDSV